MGSETPLKLPAIDFSQLNCLVPGSLAWNSLKAQVRLALEDYGCFEATFVKVPSELRNAIFTSLEQLFDLPLETKLRNYSKNQYKGYIGQYPVVPLYESLGIEDPIIPEKAQSFTNLLWPQGNPSFCNTMQSISVLMSEMDQTVRRMVLEDFGLEKYIDEHLGSTDYLFRVMKYTEPQTADPKVGLVEHTDKNIVSILYGNEVEGLEVQTKSGEWIKVQPSTDSFTFMIGKTLHAWMNGWLHLPVHRVMMVGNEARYSVGLFTCGKDGYTMKSPEELVDQDHPLLFESLEHASFVNSY